MAARAALSAVLLLAVLVAGHALAWRWMNGELAARFSDWVALRRAQGWSVQHGPPERGGWPLSARLAVPDLRIQGRPVAVPQGVAWESGRVVLRVTLPRLDRLVIEARGPQRLWVGGTLVPFAADRLEAVLPLEPGVPPRMAEVLIERLRAGTPDGVLEARRARLSLAWRITATDAEPALLLGASSDGVVLPPWQQVPAVAALGRHIERVALEAVLSGPLPPPAPPGPRAEAWRDAGGSLELRSLSLLWGPLRGDASMTLSLDETLQPMGAGTLLVAGGPEALDAMAAAGMVGRQAAAAAKAMLALMARAPDGGGPPELEVPVTIENSTLAIARLPLARLAPLAWPGRPAALPR